MPGAATTTSATIEPAFHDGLEPPVRLRDVDRPDLLEQRFPSSLEPSRVVQEDIDRDRVDVGWSDPRVLQERLERVDIRGVEMPIDTRAKEHARRHVIGPKAHGSTNHDRVDALLHRLGGGGQPIRACPNHEQGRALHSPTPSLRPRIRTYLNNAGRLRVQGPPPRLPSPIIPRSPRVPAKMSGDAAAPRARLRKPGFREDDAGAPARRRPADPAAQQGHHQGGARRARSRSTRSSAAGARRSVHGRPVRTRSTSSSTSGSPSSSITPSTRISPMPSCRWSSARRPSSCTAGRLRSVLTERVLERQARGERNPVHSSTATARSTGTATG